MKKILLLLVLLSVGPLAKATNEDPKQLFSLAYKNHQTAVKSGDKKAEKVYAKQAYELGRKLFGVEHINTANLAINYSKTLNKKEQKQVIELLSLAKPVFEDKYGENALQLVSLYKVLAGAHKILHNSDASTQALFDALDILELHKEAHPIYVANKQNEIGSILLYWGKRESKVLLDANQVLSEKLDSTDHRVIMSNFNLGKYYIKLEQYTNAIESFEKNLPVLQTITNKSLPIELVTHASLVKAYENIGESDKATEHCIAIGSMRPWDNNQDVIPLYRAKPQYPGSMLRQGISGWAKYKFSITLSGFVDDIELLSSSGPVFPRYAKKALEQWRYAPKFENGKAVRAENLKVTLNFTQDN